MYLTHKLRKWQFLKVSEIMYITFYHPVHLKDVGLSCTDVSTVHLETIDSLCYGELPNIDRLQGQVITFINIITDFIINPLGIDCFQVPGFSFAFESWNVIIGNKYLTLLSHEVVVSFCLHRISSFLIQNSKTICAPM